MQHKVSTSGSVVTASVGDEIVVELEELATAGYEWHLPDALGAGLQPGAAAQPVVSPAAIGAKSVRTIVLHVTAPGRHVVALDQYRRWEGIAKTIGHFEFVVNASGEQ